MAAVLAALATLGECIMFMILCDAFSAWKAWRSKPAETADNTTERR